MRRNRTIHTRCVSEIEVRHPCAAPELDQKLTKAYNRVLVEDVESFIRQHMKVWSADRTVVELELARAEAELLQC